MKHAMKKWMGLLLAASMLLTMTSAMAEGVDLLDTIMARGEMIVGTEGTYFPNSYFDESGELTGFDVEVARLIGEKLGVTVSFQTTEWDSLFAAMDAGRIDTVINEVEANEERGLKYDFSEPYTFIHGALLVAESNTDITTFEDMNGKRSAQNLTSSWGQMAESYGAELVSIDAVAQSIDLMTTGRADCTLNAETTFYTYMASHPEAKVKIVARTDSTTSSVVPAPKGSTKFVAAVNDALDQLRESGELAALSEKYFGADVTTAE